MYENIKRQYYILIESPVNRRDIYMRPEEKEKLFCYTDLSSREEICAGNIGYWLITYTAGLHGIDDNDSIIITRRAADDSSIPQFTSPVEVGFIQVTTVGNVNLLI